MDYCHLDERGVGIQDQIKVFFNGFSIALCSRAHEVVVEHFEEFVFVKVAISEYCDVQVGIMARKATYQRPVFS